MKSIVGLFFGIATASISIGCRYVAHDNAQYFSEVIKWLLVIGVCSLLISGNNIFEFESYINTIYVQYFLPLPHEQQGTPLSSNLLSLIIVLKSQKKVQQVGRVKFLGRTLLILSIDVDESIQTNNIGLPTANNLIEDDCHLKYNNSRNETSLKTYTRPRSLNVRSLSPKTMTCQCIWIHRNDKSKGNSKLTRIINDKPKVYNLVLFWVCLTQDTTLKVACITF